MKFTETPLQFCRAIFAKFQAPSFELYLAHQNRTIAIASDFRVDGAESPEIPQKEGVSASEMATQNRKSLATFHRTLKSQCKVSDTASDFWGPRPDLPFLAFLGKTQKSKDFFSLLRTPKVPGKEGKNAQKSKDILCNKKSKEIQKSKERKIRAMSIAIANRKNRCDFGAPV